MKEYLKLYICFNFSISYLIDNLASATVAIWLGGFITATLIGIFGYASIISIYKYRALRRVKRWK